MKVNINIFSKIKNTSFQELIAYYLKINSKYVQIVLNEVKTYEDRKIDLDSFNKTYNSKGFNIILDETGKNLSTLGLNQKIESLKLEYSDINFYIANAFGFEKEVLDYVDFNLSLSNFTFQHEMCVVLILEQLFRCFNLQAGGKYHKQ